MRTPKSQIDGVLPYHPSHPHHETFARPAVARIRGEPRDSGSGPPPPPLYGRARTPHGIAAFALAQGIAESDDREKGVRGSFARVLVEAAERTVVA